MKRARRGGVEAWEGLEEFFYGVGVVPAFAGVFANFGGEEAVEGVDLAFLAGGVDDFVDALAAPVFDCGVYGEVEEPELLDVFGADDAVEAVGGGLFSVGDDTDGTANLGSDTIGTNH